MLASKNTDIGNAFNILQIISREETARMAYEARQAELMDQRTRLLEAREDGMAEGIAIGKDEGKDELIQSILSHGVTPAQVSEMTGLPVSQIIKIQQKL